jgi:ketosteroid isomerase-like protein
MLRTTVGLALLLALSFMHPAWASKAAEEEIRTYYADLEKLINSDEYQAKDPTSLYRFQDADKMRLFDLMGEDEYVGKDYKKHLEGTAMKIRGRYEFGPLDIHADGKVAFVVYMQKFYGKKPDGGDYIIKCRTTDGLVKEAQGWRMVHEHVSMALDDKTFNALRGRKGWDDAPDK